MGLFRKKRRPRIKLSGRNYSIARRLLIDTIDILNAAGIDYMLDSGTLIGIAREGDILPWDDDVDFTLPERELEKFKKVLWKFRLRGWWISHRYQRHDFKLWKKGDYQSIKIRNRRAWLFRGRVKADFNIKYRSDEDGKYYWFMLMTKQVCEVDARFFDAYEELEYAGRRAKVPAHYDEYLTQKYGDWRTPNPDFDHHSEDGTAIGSGKALARSAAAKNE